MLVNIYIYIEFGSCPNLSLTQFLFCFWVVFWTVVAVQRPSQRLHSTRLFFYPLTRSEHGFQPSLTTRDRELVSVLEVRIEPGDLNPTPLTPQSVTVPTVTRPVECTLNLNNNPYFFMNTYRNSPNCCVCACTSRATFRIPAKRLNITIYPIIYHRWFLELLQRKQF